ncbi:MAG: ERF family protein [Methanobrevibacter sp.]|nr:ERF family protein [Methanobrevibacter sp.]
MENKAITVGSFNEVIKAVQADKRLIPDLLKAENGNNFRAVSESAILDVINPILIEHEWFYEIRVKKSDLQIREAYGSKGKKLQFIATIEVAVVFHNCLFPEEMVGTESVGMGIDDNDKAMGKAYTYAVKYALLKLFRLRFGDDPDFEASKPLHVEKPKEEKIKPENEVKKPKPAEKPQKSGKSSGMDKPMTEAQRDYILGMMKQKNVSEHDVLEKFGVEPSRDEFIPMPTARAIIKWLENDEYLPF